MLHQSRLSANDNSDNQMILEAVHRYHGIYLTAVENPGKAQPGDRLIKLCEHSSLKLRPFPPNEVGRIAQYARRGKEGRKEGRKEGNMSITSCPVVEKVSLN